MLTPLKTINIEIIRGTITQFKRQKKGKVYDYVYSVNGGQVHCNKERMHSGRRPIWADTEGFISWADDNMIHEEWSQMCSWFCLKSWICQSYYHSLHDYTLTVN